MRKLMALILVLALTLGLGCACTEQEQDNFLVSDWKLVYAYGDSVIAEQTVFIYGDNTFEVMDEDHSKKEPGTLAEKRWSCQRRMILCR